MEKGKISQVAEKVKSYGVTITTIISIIGAIGGSVIYVENNYAHADDVKNIVRNQTLQLELARKKQTEQLLFRQDYYDQQLKKLEAEHNISKEIYSDPKVSRSTRVYTRRPESIQEEIADVKKKRESVIKMMIE
jgi:ABC-type phosphate transport system substrate-binding protein